MSPRFEDYLVYRVYRGAVKPPAFGSPDGYHGTDSRCFGTDAALYAGEQVNFAGHFVVGTCTCGLGCHYLFMWDAISGKFYQQVPPGAIGVGPFDWGGTAFIEYEGEEHRANSSLPVVEGCVEDTCDCAKRYYRWTGSQFKLIIRQRVRMPAACLNKR